METILAPVVPARGSVEMKASELRAKMETSAAPSPFVKKVLCSTQNNPTASAFNIWHANGDIGIGSDNAWGTTAKATEL
jgi:hypothetical protein